MTSVFLLTTTLYQPKPEPLIASWRSRPKWKVKDWWPIIQREPHPSICCVGQWVWNLVLWLGDVVKHILSREKKIWTPTMSIRTSEHPNTDIYTRHSLSTASWNASEKETLWRLFNAEFMDCGVVWLQKERRWRKKSGEEQERSCVAALQWLWDQKESRPMRSVPYPEETVPRTGGHSHAITGHPQTADPVVMPS